MKYLETYENHSDKQKEKDLNNPDFLARWVYEDTYADKKKTYTWDTIEYLTSYFGISKKFNRKSLTKILNDVFDHKMDKKKIQYEYIDKICRQMDIKKIDGDFDLDESSILITIIDMIFDGE
jgi:hypothetical protein